MRGFRGGAGGGGLQIFTAAANPPEPADAAGGEAAAGCGSSEAQRLRERSAGDCRDRPDAEPGVAAPRRDDAGDSQSAPP